MLLIAFAERKPEALLEISLEEGHASGLFTSRCMSPML